MKLVVVGGVAGGASVAARVRRLDEEAQITVFERGEHVSFSNCALPYYLGGEVEEQEDLVLMTPKAFLMKHNIDVQAHSEVTGIDRAAKVVTVRDTHSGQVRSETYDKLVLATGAAPILPKSIQGIDGANVFTVRNVTDVAAIKSCLDRTGVTNVVVVGGGFVGCEVAENLIRAGKKVALVEGAGQILAPFDQDMVQALHKELDDHGVELHLNSVVSAVSDDSVTAVRDGKRFELPAQAVVMAIGVAPETALAVGAGLEIGQTGGVKVNASFQTSDPDIYAVGDVIESFQRETGLPGRLALAGPAQRQARIAADHICGLGGRNRGFLGSCCIRLFGMNAAATGLNSRAAAAAGLNFDSVTVFPTDMVGIMPDADYLALKLIFEVPTGKLLGAQAFGHGQVDKRIDALAALISMGADLNDLKEYEHCYAPLFSTAKDAVHMAALVAENVLTGRLKQVHVDQVRELVESGAFILDVREPGEFAAGHLKGARNLPLSQLRERLDEVPKDVPVYLHCRSSQRSYYAYRTLVGHGWNNVVNISGSFLGISLYEAFTDKDLGREPIVTAYNFD